MKFSGNWQFSRWSLDASPDVYLFILACSLKAASYGPPNTLWTQPTFEQPGKRLPCPNILKTYGAAADYALLPPRAGMLACCVEMATRPTHTFGVQQEDSLLWRTLFTKLNDYL